MQVNRYDRAAEAPIMNTYVPIDFDQLYRIGSSQREVVDKAASDLTSNIQKWSEFNSPSEKDTQNYYNLTIGKAAPLIQEMSANPDLLKSAEGRSRIQSLINNVDYGSLGRLRQSREGMLSRQKANQELMAKNMFNHIWHDVNFAEYDTLNSGIFNDVSPIPYMSEVDLVKPYVDNLKPSFLGSKDGYLWKGVTNETTDAQVSQAFSSIQNTPQYAKHIESLMQRGATQEEAVNYINSRLITAGREFAWKDAERDPWWVKQQELYAKAENKKVGESANNLTTITYRGGNKHMLDRFTSLTEQQKMDVMEGKTLDKDTEATLNEQVNPTAIRSKLQESFNESFARKKDVSKSLDDVMSVISFPASKKAADIFTSGVGGTRIKEGSYVAPTTKGLIPENKFAASALGETSLSNLLGKNTGESKYRSIIITDEINKAFEDGDFTDVETVGTGEMTTDGQNVFHRVIVYVPKEQIDRLQRYKMETKEGEKAKKKSKEPYVDTISEEQLRSAGYKIVRRGDPYESITERVDEDGNIMSRSTTVKPTMKEYVAIRSLQHIPKQGEAAITNDALYNKVRGFGTKEGFGQQVQSEYERLP